MVPAWLNTRIAGAAVEDAQYKTSWACRAILKESRLSVNDLEFAPRHLGLKLVSVIGAVLLMAGCYC